MCKNETLELLQIEYDDRARISSLKDQQQEVAKSSEAKTNGGDADEGDLDIDAIWTGCLVDTEIMAFDVII